MKNVSVLLLLIILSFPLSAKGEVWIGGNLLYDLNVPPANIKENFFTYGNAETISSVGLGVNLLYFPVNTVKIGPFVTFDFIFPVGLDSVAFISYESDFRLDFGLGVAYYQLIGPRFGFFLDFGVEYAYYRASTTNTPNNPLPVEYRTFGEWSLIADLGVIAVRKNSFFRFYAGFSYSLFSTSPGFRVLIGAGGGFII